MTEDLYIVVRNWEKFQNADVWKKSGGRPPWIKTYTALLHDDAYIELTPHQRAVLHGLWLAYASSARQLRLNTRSLSRRLGLRVSSQQLEALKYAGFIEFSSRSPLDAPLERFAPRGEESREELPAHPPVLQQDVARASTNGTQAGSADFSRICDEAAAQLEPLRPRDDDLVFDRDMGQ
ncbi:hypothetical protein BH20ACT14_BH20ACT14_01710 [soil metagenome]